MKKIFIISLIFIFGFLAGATTINLLTIPARRAYRENLQKDYIFHQHGKALTALREGNTFEAAVHLWSELEAGPPNGSNLFNSELIQELDQSFWFILYPQMNKKIDELVSMKPENEIKAQGIIHGQLAATLESLGYSKEAKKHWTQASQLLNTPYDEVEKKFKDFFKKMNYTKKNTAIPSNE